MAKILITRPEDDSLKLSQIIEKSGYETICAPFIEIEYFKPALPSRKGYDALIFTSKHAVRSFCLLSKHRDIVCYAVGNSTAKTLKNSGFLNIHTADNNVASLIKILPKNLKYLYIRGKNITQFFDEIDYESVITYGAKQIDGLSDEVVNIILKEEVSDIVFYSKRTAESFIKYTRLHHSSDKLIHCLRRTRVLCLSDEVLKYVSQLSKSDEKQIIWQNIVGAQASSNESLIDLIKQK